MERPIGASSITVATKIMSPECMVAVSTRRLCFELIVGGRHKKKLLLHRGSFFLKLQGESLSRPRTPRSGLGFSAQAHFEGKANAALKGREIFLRKCQASQIDLQICVVLCLILFLAKLFFRRSVETYLIQFAIVFIGRFFPSRDTKNTDELLTKTLTLKHCNEVPLRTALQLLLL